MTLLKILKFLKHNLVTFMNKLLQTNKTVINSSKAMLVYFAHAKPYNNAFVKQFSRYNFLKHLTFYGCIRIILHTHRPKYKL